MPAGEGLDTRLIQDILGHRVIRNTVRYTMLAPHCLASVRGAVMFWAACDRTVPRRPDQPRSAAELIRPTILGSSRIVPMQWSNTGSAADKPMLASAEHQQLIIRRREIWHAAHVKRCGLPLAY